MSRKRINSDPRKERGTIPSRHGRHVKRRARRGFIIIAALLMVAMGALAGFLFSSSLLDKVDPGNRTGGRLKKQELLVAKDKATILIMGVDTREDDVGRSDTMMVAAVDPKKKQASLLSVPRDTRVHIEGYGYEKINAAFMLGGRKLAQSTVEDFLGTPIDHYVMINNRAFKKVIDAIGGIDIDVEMRMDYEDPWDDDGGLVIDLYPGYQHLNGKQAIGYVRYRDEEGDIGRIARQQKFVKAVMEKVTSPGIITDLPEIASVVYENIETDMSLRQLLELAGAFKEAKSQGLKAEMIPGEPYDNPEDGLNYWVPSIYTTREMVADVLGVPMNGAAKRAMENDAAEYAASLPAHIRDSVSVDDSDAASVKSGKSVKSDKTSKKETVKSESRTAKKKKSKPKAPAVKDEEEERPTETAASDRDRDERRESAEDSEEREVEERKKSADDAEDKKSSEDEDSEEERPAARRTAPGPAVSPSMRGGKGR
ncbi:MAG: LCP family protein [Selenomonadaceae bacterium]|nr:LCP family protein [Selenomonadaceae bacterium]